MVANSSVTPDYFWHNLSLKEANSIVEDVNNRYKANWEQTRFVSYINCLLQGSKLKSPKDLILFDWEKEDKEVITEDLELVKQRLLELAINS